MPNPPSQRYSSTCPSLILELVTGLGVHLLLPRMVEESREFPQWYPQSSFGDDVAC
jgi:hypothetical protein